MPLIHKVLLGSVFFISFTTVLSAKDHLMIIGGGGEAKAKPGTLFDNSLKGLAEYTKRNPELITDVAFNGGHPDTETILNNDFSADVKKSPFREADYKRLIQDYMNKLQNEELVKGDQLMIFIDSHGAEKQPQFKTHAIATTIGNPQDLNSLNGSVLVDLDQLEALKNLAKDKGVKVAIIDNSCHSGNTLSLADENTCVISATGPNHYGYATFSDHFVELMQKGKNLEEIFLETRAMDRTPAFPMISTSQGIENNTILYEKITPYLYYFDAKNDKLTPFIQTQNDINQLCISQENFLSLIQTIDKIEEMYTETTKILWWTKTKKHLDLQPLKTLLGQYKSALDQITKDMQVAQVDRLKNEVTITPKVDFYVSSSVKMPKISWGNLIKTDYDQFIDAAKERLKNETDPTQITAHKWNLAYYTQAKAKKEEILAANPDLSTIMEKDNNIQNSISLNFETAQKIAIEERKLYQVIYKRESLQTNKAPASKNACQNFQL